MALADYWAIPFTRGWLRLKGHIAYGMLTDQNWQHDFTNRQSRFTDRGLFHSKAGYLKIGNEDVFNPWSLELGLEMVTLFGGTSYIPSSNGNTTVIEKWKRRKRLFGMHFFLVGQRKLRQLIKNVEGDQLGSWVMRLNYDGDVNSFSFYADKFFEDHSSMFQLDYDGYGEGSEWMEKKKQRLSCL